MIGWIRRRWVESGRSQTPGCVFLALGLLSGACHVVAADAQVPWVSGEWMVFEVMGKDEGPLLGHLLLSVRKSEREGTGTWRVESKVSGSLQGYSVVEMDREGLLPQFSLFSQEGLGEVEARFHQGEVLVSHRLRRDAGRLRQQERTYELYQSAYLMRRFPVESAYQETVYVVDSRRPAKQFPLLMKVAEVRALPTLEGQKTCYRVNVRIGDARMSYWVGADEQRLIYRVEEEGGRVLRLVAYGNGTDEGWVDLRHGHAANAFVITLPEDWYVVPKEVSGSGEAILHLDFLYPGSEGTFSMTRHRVAMEWESVYEGSIRWLKEHRRGFEVIPGREFAIEGGGLSGRSFVGSFEGDQREMLLFHAVVTCGDYLHIFTGHGPKGAFEGHVESLDSIVRSLRSHE